MKTALLLLAGTPPSPQLLVEQLLGADLFVVADGAANGLPPSPRPPDLIVGDLDSLQPNCWQEIPRLPLADQNTSDAEKCLTYLLKQGVEEIRVLGSTGGRQDHQLYHYHLIGKPEFANQRILLFGEEDCAFVGQARLELQGWPRRKLSLLPLYGPVVVKSQGLAWELTGQALEMGQEASLSNEFSNSQVNLEIQGQVLVILQTQP